MGYTYIIVWSDTPRSYGDMIIASFPLQLCHDLTAVFVASTVCALKYVCTTRRVVSASRRHSRLFTSAPKGRILGRAVRLGVVATSTRLAVRVIAHKTSPRLRSRPPGFPFLSSSRRPFRPP
jgi:hypothetical protein